MEKKRNFKVKDEELLTPLEAGRILGVGADSIRYLHRIGKLRAIRTAGGNRLFFKQDLEELRQHRQIESEGVNNEYRNQ